ncbi:MAG TPA: M3 family metallopeptidase, partial [Thermomicrobiales bacterium]|nr:M3 family metallopeptidase [Thermomicrobiales bacterium]
MSSVTPDQLRSATWDEIVALYQPLLDASLDRDDPEVIEQWLAAWSNLDAALQEAAVLAMMASAADVNDAKSGTIHQRFDGEIMPRHKEILVALAAKLLDSGYTRPDLETTIQRFRIDREIFRTENIPLQQRLSALKERYNNVCGNMTVDWQGESIPPSRLNRFLQDPDRNVRESAWRASFQPYVDQRDTLADIFDEMLELRQRIARNAGFSNYRDYAFTELHRVDYTPDDCRTFHESTRATFVPATTRIMDAHRQALGVDSLRPWDLDADPEQRPAPEPLPSIDALTDAAANAVRRVDPTFGDQFDGLRERGLLDLDSRAGKRPGGFCFPLAWQKQATIFMNSSASPLDLTILLHESGHAFHEISMANLPIVHQRAVGEEMCEVASMSME